MLCFSFLPYNCISGWQSLSSRSNKAVCLKYTVKRKGEVRMYNFLLLRFLVSFVLYFCLFGCLEPLSVSDKKKKAAFKALDFFSCNESCVSSSSIWHLVVKIDACGFCVSAICETGLSRNSIDFSFSKKFPWGEMRIFSYDLFLHQEDSTLGGFLF